MNAVAFKLGNYTSRTTGEVSKKLVVKFSDGRELFMWLNKPEFKDKDIDESVAIIKADRDSYLNQIVVADTQYGLQAQFSIIADAEEF